MDFSKYLVKNVCRLTCGSETATAFLVSTDLVITATHCVGDSELNREPIILDFLEYPTPIKRTAIPVDDLNSGYNKPVILLKMEQPIEMDFLQFTKHEPKSDEPWETFGYPAVKKNIGQRIKGEISRVTENLNIHNWNIDLDIDSKIDDYSGFSGAPLIVNQKVVGVILAQSTENYRAISIGAIGVQRFIDVLDSYNILALADNSNYFETTTIEDDLKANIVYSNSIIRGISSDVDNYKGQLGEIYEEQLDKLINRRLDGDIDGAWDELTKDIEGLAVRNIPKKISARYYYMAAQWTLSDFRDLNEADRYFKYAIALDSELDTRPFQSKILAQEEKYSDALALLNPIDKETILNTALHILFISGQGDRVEDILSEATVKPNHSSRHILALCSIQTKKYSTAEKYIQQAIADYPKSPVYHLTAGLIDYWQGMPNDICETGNIMPVFINTNFFKPSKQQLEKFEEAIKHYKKAQQYADYYRNVSIESEILQAYMLTLSMMPDRQMDAERILTELLRIDPYNSIALLYAAENCTNVDSDILTTLKNLTHEKNSNLNLVSALVRIYIKSKNGQDALRTLEKFKQEFSINNALEAWTNLMVESYLVTKDFTDAQKLLDETVEVDEYARSRIKGYILERQGKNIELLELSMSLARNPGTRLDYANLAFIYKKLGDWENAITIAGIWYSKYYEISALELTAEAQLSLHRAEDCLETLDKLAAVLPDNNLTEQGQWYKLHALRMLSKLDEAISIANEIWGKSKNERIVILRARLNLSNGDKTSAISILRDGISLGYTNSEIYIILADLIKLTHPQEAFDFAKKAIEKSPNNPSIHLQAAMLGFNTGNDNEAHRLIVEFQEKFPDSKLLRQYPTTDFIPMITEWRQKSEEIWNLFTDGKIPLHLVLDYQNITMGLDFYSKWTYNSKVNYKLQIPIILAFGGRTEIEDMSVFTPNNIFMDYSACLIAYKLNLFDNLKMAFTNITVSSFLLTLISMEIDKIQTKQPRIIENRKKLLSSKNKLRLTKIDIPLVNKDEFQVEDQDLQKYTAAKKHNALIVDDSFATEIIYGRQIPEEIKSLQIYTQEVLSALVQRGLISSGTAEPYIHGKIIRQDIVEKLVSNKYPLLVDIVFLEMINELGCIETVTDVYDLLIFDNTFEHIEAELNAYEKHEEAAKWLEKLRGKLIELKQEGKLLISPVMNDDCLEKVDVLQRIILEMLHSNHLIWCDDRTINSYPKSENASIVGIFDVIEYLYKMNIIPAELYRSKIGELIRSGIKYHVPPQIYIKMCLNMAVAVPETLLIRETNSLRDIRHSIISSLSDGTLMGRHKLAHVNFPELVGYLINLTRTFEDCMLYIWTIEGKDNEWREASATWLLLNCSDSVSDITHLTGTTGQPESLVSSKHSLLICMGLRMTLNLNREDKTSPLYFKWLFTWLERFWIYNPDNKNITIESVVDFICSIAKKELEFTTNEYENKTILVIISKIINNLPDSFREDLERHPRIQELFGINYIKVLIIDGLPSIPEQIWKKCISNAINRGAGNKGTEKFEDYTISLTFIEDKVISQRILLEWAGTNGEIQQVNILEPYAQLYNDNSHIRLSWLELARDYIYWNQNVEYYQEGLASQEYTMFVDELIDNIEKTPDFFFNRLAVLLKNDHEKIPKEKDLFPHDPQVFINELSFVPSLDDVDSQLWLSYFYDYIEKIGLKIALNLFSALPLGGSWHFGKIVEKAIEKGVVDRHLVLEWCYESLRNSTNPLRQQNLLSFLLRNTFAFNQEYWDLIGVTFITLLQATERNEEINNNHSFFITLLKLSWLYMGSIKDYKLIDNEHLIMWSYIYADKIHSICNELIKNREVPYEIAVYNQTFESLLKRLKDNDRRIFYNESKPILEVAVPGIASIYRIVLGGTLSIIEENAAALDPIKEILIPIVKKLTPTNMTQINGAEELVLGFENVDNYFKTCFNKNVFKRIQNILIGWKTELIEDFDHIHFYKNILDNLSEGKELGEEQLLYLVILARQPFPDELVPLISDVLKIKKLLPDDLPDDLLKVRGKMIYIIINALPKKDMDNILQILIDDLKHIFIENFNRWEVFVELLATFCSTDYFNEASANFISLLEEVLLKESNMEINADFGEFLSAMVWWLPSQLTERVHKLRRSVIW